MYLVTHNQIYVYMYVEKLLLRQENQVVCPLELLYWWKKRIFGALRAIRELWYGKKFYHRELGCWHQSVEEEQEVLT